MCEHITGILETAYTILKRKQTERWTKRRNTQLRSNKLLSITAREKERKRRRRGEKEVEGWETGGRDKGWEEHKEEREKIERWRMYVYILHT